jgi:hypothetical protein
MRVTAALRDAPNQSPFTIPPSGVLKFLQSLLTQLSFPRKNKAFKGKLEEGILCD